MIIEIGPETLGRLLSAALVFFTIYSWGKFTKKTFAVIAFGNLLLIVKDIPPHYYSQIISMGLSAFLVVLSILIIIIYEKTDLGNKKPTEETADAKRNS